MKKILSLEKTLPVAVYNTDVPELIAIFKERRVLAKYAKIINSRISIGIRDKTKFRKTSLQFPITLRNANETQINTLGNDDYILCVDYIPKIPFNMVLGFHSTRESLHNEQVSTIERPNVRRGFKHKKQEGNNCAKPFSINKDPMPDIMKRGEL